MTKRIECNKCGKLIRGSGYYDVQVESSRYKEHDYCSEKCLCKAITKTAFYKMTITSVRRDIEIVEKPTEESKSFILSEPHLTELKNQIKKFEEEKAENLKTVNVIAEYLDSLLNTVYDAISDDELVLLRRIGNNLQKLHDRLENKEAS